MIVKEMHEIQERVLKELSYEDKRSFSDLQGEEESNKLAFHLKKLREENLLVKEEDRYMLTKKAREILPYFDLDTGRHPVTVVDLLIFSGDNVYLKPKDTDPMDPFSGFLRTPSRRLSRGERIEEKTEEILEEHLGVEDKKSSFAGVFDSTMRFEDGSSQHYILFFYKTEVDNISEDLFELESLEELDVLPGLDKVIEEIKSSESVIEGKWDIVKKEDGSLIEQLDIS